MASNAPRGPRGPGGAKPSPGHDAQAGVTVPSLVKPPPKVPPAAPPDKK
jgi:hypothetical protein